MSESTWGEGEMPPPPKKKIPTWLWFCGGGCLLALILGIVAVAWFASYIKDATNPEKQWPHVAEVLPFDARPPELELKLGHHLGMDMYVFDDSRGFAVVLMQFGTDKSKEVQDKLMNPDVDGGFMGFGNRKEATAGKIRVQGRDLEVLRFHQMESEKVGEGDTPPVGQGPSILVNLTPETGGKPLILQLVRLHGTDPVSDEDVIRFLKPFHVGTER